MLRSGARFGATLGSGAVGNCWECYVEMRWRSPSGLSLLVHLILPRVQTRKRRSGVPQYVHPHALSGGGADAIEALLPGFKKEVSGC